MLALALKRVVLVLGLASPGHGLGIYVTGLVSITEVRSCAVRLLSASCVGSNGEINAKESRKNRTQNRYESKKC